MKIQLKLAMILGATIAAVVTASCLAFVGLQRDSLRRSEVEKERLLVEESRSVSM